MNKRESCLCLRPESNYGATFERKVYNFRDIEDAKLAEQELRALMKFRSGNFIPIYQYETSSRQITIDYEQYDYGDIGYFVSQLHGFKLNEKGILLLLIPILKSLYSIHQIGFVHGNIKIDTILINKHGDVSLSQMECMTKSDIQGNKGKRHDIYCLGEVLYYLVTFQKYQGINSISQLTEAKYLHGSYLIYLIKLLLNMDFIVDICDIIQSEFILHALIKYRDCSLFVYGGLDQTLLIDRDSNQMNCLKSIISAPETLISYIGQGSFGVVSSVRRGDTEFAKKVVPFSHDSTSGIDADNEYGYCQKFFHNNIITTFLPLCRRENEETNIYLELCHCSVNDICLNALQNRNLSVIGVFKILCSIINALYCLHDNHFIHRDIKPQNILITKGGTILLSDLGTIIQSMGNLNDIQGTPQYWAPEIINGDSFSDKIDIYALGCLLYFLCTFKNFNDSSQLFVSDENQILDDDNSANDRKFILPEIYKNEPALQNILNDMTEVNPMKRISCEDLIQDEAIIKYNYHTRNIPFLLPTGEVNPIMIMKVEDLINIDGQNSNFSLYEYIINGMIPLPSSNLNYIMFISDQIIGELSDISTNTLIINDFSYLYPRLSIFEKDFTTHSLEIRQNDQRFIEKLLLIFLQYFKLLGYKVTIYGSNMKLAPGPKFSPQQWSNNTTVMESFTNILSILDFLRSTLLKLSSMIHQKITLFYGTIRSTIDYFPQYFPFREKYMKIWMKYDYSRSQYYESDPKHKLNTP